MVEFLENECNQALDNILKNVSTLEAVEMEQKLWKSIFKAYKTYESNIENKYSLINYLIGYYLTLQEALFFKALSKDNYLKFSRYGFLLSNSNQELLYNIHVRIGDLYRYADARDNAKHYYQKALQIDPRRGFAYKQLALCTPITKAYKCIYYSVRAYNSTIEPMKNSDSIIKLGLSRIDCQLFENFRKITKTELDDKAMNISIPENGQDWFYFTVISIHFNDLNVVLNLLLDQILKTIDEDAQNMELDYLLMSLDVSLDWILKDRLNLKHANSIENLKSFNSKVKFNAQLKAEKNNIALLHNLILKDFLPLKSIYENMEYYKIDAENYKIDKHRKILISRLIYKLQNF